MPIKSAIAQELPPAGNNTLTNIPDVAVDVAVKGVEDIFNVGVIGVLLVAALAFIVWLMIKFEKERAAIIQGADKQQELDREAAARRDDLFTKALDRHANSADKLTEAIGQLSRDVYRGSNNNNHRTGN